jgi:RNA polymerase primary sigma factor
MKNALEKHEDLDLELDLLTIIAKHQSSHNLDTINMFNSYKDNDYLFGELESSTDDEYSTALLNQLVMNNQKLVKKIALKYKDQSGSLSYEDLINEGNIGLFKAIDKFDLSKEFQFSTYATHWIKQSISRAIADKSLTIRIPVHRFDKIKKMRLLEIKMAMDNKYTFDHLLKDLEINKEQYMQLKLYEVQFFNLGSVDIQIGEEEDTDLLSFISSNVTNHHLISNAQNEFDIESSIDNIFLSEGLDKALSTLSDREYNVISLRFGLEDGRDRTLEEVGKIFGLTRERIRQIESKALKKLRHPSRQKYYKDFLLNK